jgi:photosystem II stability/assembly factor-like uncharacterized protein
MNRRIRLATVALAAVTLASCRGGTGALPPGHPLTAFQNSATLPLDAIRFVPIGPTHMTSGGVPNSGKVNAFAQDPANPNIIYVASGRGTGLETYSSAGVFRSRDGGKTWAPILSGLTDPSGLVSSVVNALWIDPRRPNVLLAATEYDGIFRTTNGGTSWQNVYRTTQATQFVAYGGALYASAAAGILASTDDGAAWSLQLAGTKARYPRALGAASGAHGSALYAGMSDGSIFAYARGRWTRTGSLPYDPKTGTQGSQPAVHQIAVDPLTPASVYASSNDGRWDQALFVSTDAGTTWKKVVPFLPPYGSYYNVGLGTQAIAFSALHPHLLYIGLDGGLVWIDANGSTKPQMHPAANLSVIDVRDVWTMPHGSGDRCWIASDQGLDDVPACSVFTPRPNDDVASSTLAIGLARRFAISPNGKTIVVSLQDFDSHISWNGGRSWTEYFNYRSRHSYSYLYEDGFNEIKPDDPRVCYAYDEASGLQVSTDGCHTYASPSQQAAKLLPSRLMTTPIAFDPSNPANMYLLSGAIVGAGFPPTPQAAWLTTDDGRTFTRLAWPVTQPGMIAIDPHRAAHIIVGDLRNSSRSSMLVSFDGGKHWKRSAGVPATAFWYSATISPADGNVVLASSVDASNNVFVLRSTDGGRTFKRIADVTNAPLIRGRIDVRCCRAAFVYSPAREIRFNQAVVEGTPDVVLTTLRGAFLSTDLGSRWHRLDGALIAHSFWGIRWLHGYLYLASDGQGVLRSTVPIQKP